MPEFYHAPSPVTAAPGKPHIFIATPAVQIFGNHMAAIARGLPMLLGSGVAADHFLLMDCCHVDDARNICVARFLSSKADALLFIDADVGFGPDALYRMAMMEGDVIGGAYPRKSMQQRSYPIKLEGETEAGDDGVIRKGVTGLPAGFLKISRRVLERMADERVGRMFRADGDPMDAPLIPIVFERSYERGERRSGDYAFCKWAAELGFEVALDPMLAFTHAGAVRFYGCLAQDMAAVHAEPNYDPVRMADTLKFYEDENAHLKRRIEELGASLIPSPRAQP